MIWLLGKRQGIVANSSRKNAPDHTLLVSSTAQPIFCINQRQPLILRSPLPSVDSSQAKQTVKAFEIYQKIDPSPVSEMFFWIRENDRQLYKSAIATLTANRNLRPVFVEQKSVADQIAWLHKTLKLKTSDTIGEHLFQVYFMKGQQELLMGFCDGMGIKHDGEGSVEGALPDTLNSEKLKSTVDSLVEKHDPKLVTLYLRIFNLQTQNGWKNLAQTLESDERLVLA